MAKLLWNLFPEILMLHYFLMQPCSFYPHTINPQAIKKHTGSLHYHLRMPHCQHNYFYFLLLSREVNEYNISRDSLISRPSQFNMNVKLSRIITLFYIIHDVVVNNFNIIKNVYVRNIFNLFCYSSRL